MEALRGSRSLTTLLRVGFVAVVLAAYFVDGWLFGTFRARIWAAPVASDPTEFGGAMVGVTAIVASGVAWAVWPRTTPVVALVAAAGSLVITANLDGRSRFPFFAESVVLIALLGALLWQRAAWSWVLGLLVVMSGVAISLRAPDGGIRNVLAATMLVLFAAVVTVVVYAWMKDDERRVGIELARRTERLELARELHDIVGHHVTGIVVLAQASRFAGAGGPADTERILADIERAGVETLTSVRRLVGLLRDDSPTAAGPRLEDIEQLVADLRATHPRAVLDTDPAILAGGIPADLATTVHRIVQEAATNVRRHGDPGAPVTIAVRRTVGTIDIEVRNRRLPGAVHPGAGYGLIGMRERVEALGGEFTAGPAGDQSWVVRVTLPREHA